VDMLRPSVRKAAERFVLLEDELKEELMSIRHEDLSNVLSLNGVLAALVLSFVVSLQWAAVPEEMQKINFKTLICSSSEFRAYAKHVLQEYPFEVGPFNFTRTWVNGGALDLDKELTVGIAQRSITTSHPLLYLIIQQNLIDAFSCAMDPLNSAVLEILAAYFPMHYVDAYIAYRDPSIAQWGDIVETNAALANGFVFLSLVWSTLLYYSLSVSESSRDGSGKATKKWLKCGGIAMGLNFALLIIGVVLFLMGHVDYLVAKSTIIQRTATNVVTIQLLIIILPGVLVVAVVAVCAWVAAARKDEIDGDVDSDEFDNEE